MKTTLFTGVCTALVTPFLDGKVNYPMAEQLLRRQIGAGIPAVVIAGTTGESAALTTQEKLELFRRCKDIARNDCLIIAGTGSNSTQQTIELSKAAQDVGADALLVVSPYYNKGTPGGLIAHYAAIASAVNIPIILYNVPSRTGFDIPVAVYEKLSKIPNIIGVKEASTDIAKIAKIRLSCGSDFSVWTGNDDQIVPAISMGGKGVISVLSNICPERTAEMVTAALSGDYETASALQCQFMSLIELLFCEVNPVPVKAILRQIGYDCGTCRLPLSDPKPENVERICRFLS